MVLKKVGFTNYVTAFNDPTFLDSFKFTALFTVVSVVVINCIGFGLALLVTTGMKGNNLLRTIFFMPNLIGGLILGFIWQFIFTQVFAGLGNVLHQRHKHYHCELSSSSLVNIPSNGI
ncbi:hypothetical protein Ctaglu_04050 [Clostridium tagluense]|uniref:ABC transmembrane type-1 domain-containing protein n=1 Tax=Clostridium tagluense TaxID=360422 RepID=A0A401UH30_9CLOT|nr:hypothetical protein Ctaglu_04050 [Clostridium tagluense]